jgi:predicted DNA-binding ribbon-helix-helix protein
MSLEIAPHRIPTQSATAPRRIKVSDLVKEIGAKRKHSNFSSELRLFVLEFYRKQANLPD